MKNITQMTYIQSYIINHMAEVIFHEQYNRGKYFKIILKLNKMLIVFKAN